MRITRTLLMMFWMVLILTGCGMKELQKSPAPDLILEYGWLQTFNQAGNRIDLQGTEMVLHDGSKAFLRDNGSKVPLKCMPAEDADKMETYIKFLKRR